MRFASLLEERWAMKAAGWNPELSRKYKNLQSCVKTKENMGRWNQWLPQTREKRRWDKQRWKKQKWMDQDSKRARRLEENGKQVRKRGSSTSWHRTPAQKENCWLCMTPDVDMMQSVRDATQLMQRNNDPELREGLSAAWSGEELRERLPTDVDDPETLDAWILDRARSCSRKTKVSTKDGTGEHKSLPHYSFLLFKVDVDWIYGILGFSLVVRIHLNLSQQQAVYSSFIFCVTAHCRQQCPSCTPCQERKAQQSSQILFLRGYDPCSHARGARPLTDVGWPYLSVSWRFEWKFGNTTPSRVRMCSESITVTEQNFDSVENSMLQISAARLRHLQCIRRGRLVLVDRVSGWHTVVDHKHELWTYSCAKKGNPDDK